MKNRRFLKIILSILFVAIVVSTSLSVFAARGSSLGGGAGQSGTAPVKPAPVSVDTDKPTLDEVEVPEDTTELSVVLQAGEIDRLDDYPALTSVDLSGSTCYEEILAWAEKHPDVAVRYTVSLPDGQVLDNGAEKVDLSGADSAQVEAAAPLLAWLPALRSVDLGTGSGSRVLSGEAVSAVREAVPDAEVSYAAEVLGKTYSLDTEKLDLSGASSAQLSEAVSALAALPGVRTVVLGGEDGALGWDDVAAFHEACPDVAMDYHFRLYGKDLNLADEELNFHKVAVGDEGAAIRKILPYMVNCKRLDLDGSGVPTAALVKFREDFPEVDTIWRINFGTAYSVRTDAVRILASKPSVGGDLHDADVAPLKYCNHAKYVDLGHNEALTNVDFCKGMPDLEVLVAAMNPITDISPLADCHKLEYLELNTTAVTDLSPLSELKSLRHLNVANCKSLTDISPLYGLTDLERLWIGCITPIPAEQVEHMRQVAPECDIDTEVTDPTTGHWRLVGYTELSLLLFDETGWLQEILHPRYELLREQFGYGDGDFSFSWNDPLF